MASYEDEPSELWESMAQLVGPFVEWAPGEAWPPQEAAVLQRGHPGVIVERGPRHLNIVWIGHENELVTTGAVYDTSCVREIDVYTFCRRVLSNPSTPSHQGIPRT